MIVVANRIWVAEGHEGDFEDRFINREWSVDRLPGFVRNEVLRPVKGECYVVKTYWETMEDFGEWAESEEFRKAHANAPPQEAFSRPNQLEIHEVMVSHGKPQSSL